MVPQDGAFRIDASEPAASKTTGVRFSMTEQGEIILVPSGCSQTVVVDREERLGTILVHGGGRTPGKLVKGMGGAMDIIAFG